VPLADLCVLAWSSGGLAGLGVDPPQVLGVPGGDRQSDDARDVVAVPLIGPGDDGRHERCPGVQPDAGLRVVALGHASATITLNTYAHLWPTAEDRTRAAAASLLVDVLGPADEPLTNGSAA
jgi:hypothetical protein